ncbi:MULTISPECIES: bile acid:sodium symporter family protein [unclassified Streptomyces]|uniref:bile acid:sodium symporter family protein n=1 Tax=unclassified Streptomyces TaxID=2593676 RepID=UPI0035D64F89
MMVTVGLPIAIGIVMAGLGLSLKWADFTRVLTVPRAVLLALACQFLVIPLVGLALIAFFDPEPALAVGVMLLVATPGGPMSNLLSHLAGADVALNVTITALTSVISAVTFPLIANLSIQHLLEDGARVGLQFSKIVWVVAVVLVPIVVGMLVRRAREDFARRMERPVKIFSTALLAVTIAGAIVSEREHIGPAFRGVGHIVLLLVLLSIAIGYGVPRLGGVAHRQAVAASLEIGLHNTPLAIAIALSPVLLNDPTMAFAPAAYALLSVPIACLYTFLVARTLPRTTEMSLLA